MTLKKVAVIGAGFAGLAAAWHLCSAAEVTVIAEEGGSSASEVSAGLLHPYAGARAKLNWRGLEAMKATLPLLDVASEALGESVYRSGGINRVAFTEEQASAFYRASTCYGDVEWLTSDEMRAVTPSVASRPGIWIRSGVTVFTGLYLQGLKIALQKRGVLFEKGRVDDVDKLAGFDAKVLCLGAGIFSHRKMSDIPLRGVKGQLLELPWPHEMPPLQRALNSKIYIVMSSCNRNCFVGSTFERNYDSSESNMAVAERLLLPQLEELYPPLVGITPTSCRSAVRVAAPNHLPYAGKVAKGCWLFTGLGSKGLLYHSLFGEEVARQILAET